MQEGSQRPKWPWILVAVLIMVGILGAIGVMRWGQASDAEFKALMDDQARKILKAAIRAKGGLANIANIKDITVKSKSKLFSAEGEPEVQITLYIKVPDKLRYIESAQGQEGIMVVNGDQGWLKRRDSIQELPIEVVRSLKWQIQNNDDFIFLKVKQPDYQFKYVGTRALNETRADVIQMIDPAGNEMTLYLDTKSHHLVKLVRQGSPAEGQIEALFSDYRKLGGVMTPFHSKEFRGGQLVSETQILEAKFNSGLSDDLFKKPE